MIAQKILSNPNSQYDELLLRILHSNKFNFEESLETAKKNLYGMKNAWKNPIIFDTKSSETINKGIAYIFGRDNRLRPIMVIKLKQLYHTLTNGAIDKKMLKTVIVKLMSYSEEKLWVKGKVETWVMIVDCEDLNYSSAKTVSVSLFSVVLTQLGCENAKGSYSRISLL